MEHDPSECKEKVCLSVEDMMRIAAEKKAKRAQQEGNKPSTSEVPKPHRTDCPVDREELGRSTWKLLHTMAAYYPEKPSPVEKNSMKSTIESLSKTYPCSHCAEDFRKDLKENPIKLENRSTLSQWMCELHNRVNEKLGKDSFDCSKVMERWKEGWRDGSCDP